MAMTLVQAQTAIVARLKVLLTAAGMSIVTATANADLHDGLQTALLQMDLDIADPLTNTEIGAVENADLLEFLLRAELRTLKNIQGNIEGSDLAMPVGKSENRSQLVDQVNAMLKEVRADLAAALEGSDAAAGNTILVGGKVSLDFQEYLPTEANP